MNWQHRIHAFAPFLLPLLCLALLLPLSCTRRLTECEGPEINFNALNAIRNNLTRSGPQGVLVLPNPIDATKNPQALAADAATSSAGAGLFLNDLSTSAVLENGFVRIRLHAIDDALSLLAKPDGNGQYRYPVSDPHYSETMAYYSVNTAMKYIETLGFAFVKSRPLYVLARSDDPSGDTDTINAYYEHHYLDPSSPRIMRLIGNGQFAPGIDRDMYWHELGHFANESISHEVGIDFAADLGAIYTEASAIHEATADYIAESLGNKSFIGTWINRNFEPDKPGKPLRQAVDSNGNRLTYNQVATFDASKGYPERYTVAEWATRALWDMRSQMVKEDPANGAVIADRVVFSAISQLKRDTSIKQFHDALLDADQSLHCGLHQRSISNAFSSRGFVADEETLDGPLSVQAAPTKQGAAAAGADVVFQMRITNNRSQRARNVRVKLETSGAGFHTTQYLQAYGDLAPGQTIVIGDNGLNATYSVAGIYDGTSNAKVTYRLSVLVENGETASLTGEIPR